MCAVCPVLCHIGRIVKGNVSWLLVYVFAEQRVEISINRTWFKFEIFTAKIPLMKLGSCYANGRETAPTLPPNVKFVDIQASIVMEREYTPPGLSHSP